MKKSISVISFYSTGLSLPLLSTGMFYTEAEKKYFFQLRIQSDKKHIGKRNYFIGGEVLNMRIIPVLSHANKFNSKYIAILYKGIPMYIFDTRVYELQLFINA